MSYPAPSDFAKIAELERQQNEIRDIVFFNSVHAVSQSNPFGQGRKNTALGSKLGSESWFPLESAITDINELLVSTGVFDKLDVQSIANVIIGPVGTLILKTIKNISDGKIFSVTPGTGRILEITPGGGGGDDGKGIEVASTLTLTDKDLVFMQYFKDTDKVKIIAGSSVPGANINLSNIVDTQISAGLIPDADNVHHFGSVTNRWADAHVVIGLFNTVTVSVSLTASAAFFALGNTTLGDAITDSITVNGRFASSLLPITNNLYDLGAIGNQWRDLFLTGEAHIDDLFVDIAVKTDLIPSPDSTLDLGSSANRWLVGFFDNLNASGTGSISVTTITATSSLTSNGPFFALGNVDLGDAIGDAIAVNGRFTTDLDPSATAVRDLGASGLIWDDLWIDQIIVRDRIRSDSATSEMGFFVKNETGTLGTLGTMQAPLLEQAALPTDTTLDGFFGAFNGAFGFWRDTDNDPNSRGFVRMNGVWYHWFLTNL